jgi:putative aldouronate transport system substrate-binding protein
MKRTNQAGKKFLGLVLPALLFAAAGMGCGKSPQSSAGTAAGPVVDRSNFNALGSYPLVKQKETITVMWPVSSLDLDYDSNWLTVFYEEKTNVHVNFILALAAQYKERVNLALASDEQVDLVISSYGQSQYSATDVMRLANQQAVLPLQDYIASDTINIKNSLNAVQGWRDVITAPDGNIYVVPYLNDCRHCAYYGKMWVNMEFLKNLGLDIPRTPEEFRQMLIAFRDKDANGNGDPSDEIPFAGVAQQGDFSGRVDTYLMSAFVYNDGENRLYIDNGKVTAAFAQDGFQEGLRYLRQLYAEKLIYPASFTQDINTRSQLNSQKYESIIGAIPYAHHGQLGNRETGQPVRWIDYVAIPPLTGPKGFRAARYDHYQQFETHRVNFIPAACKNPALVLRWADWFFTEEGTLTTTFGGKGIGWGDADPGSSGVDGNPAAYKVFTLQPGDEWYQNRNWGSIVPTTMRSAAFRAGQQQPADYLAPDGTGAERALYLYTTENYLPYGWPPEKQIPPLFYADDAISELALLRTNINTYVEEGIAKFVTGDLNVDRDWAAFQQNLKNLGLERYLQIIQDTYNKSSFVKR